MNSSRHSRSMLKWVFPASGRRSMSSIEIGSAIGGPSIDHTRADARLSCSMDNRRATLLQGLSEAGARGPQVFFPDEGQVRGPGAKTSSEPCSPHGKANRTKPSGSCAKAAMTLTSCCSTSVFDIARSMLQHHDGFRLRDCSLARCLEAICQPIADVDLDGRSLAEFFRPVGSKQCDQ